ncbi:MAG: bifunctional diguanylate cyclase/phosphodiesterase [Zoogloea sp.]|nr:bifunctional diguanylate cyclase/phosphodiesterase [Zoogloea sp.]
MLQPHDAGHVDLEALRLRVIDRLTSLLESQTRTNVFSSSLRPLVRGTHAELIARIDAAGADGKAAMQPEALQEIRGMCERLDASMSLLVGERARQWDENSRDLLNLIGEFDQMFSYLMDSLVERDLLERQSQVLEHVILSHERIGQWKEFVQAILSDFHAIFPFDMFFVAFAEEHGLVLYVYYFGETTEADRQNIRRRLAQHMIASLGLPPDSPLDYEEFHIQRGKRIRTVDTNQMITVKVPEHAPQLAGLLGVTFLSSVALTPREQSVVRAILAVMVMVVGSSKVLSRTLAELEYYSAHDPLTGLYNRRQFQAMLDYETGRSARHKHEFAILLLDMDDFKDVNDTYGHPTGDQVLCGVAETLRALTRKGDLATRIGGDEFAVMLTETNQAGAMRVAQKIGKALREKEFVSPNGNRFHITVSIGVVSYPVDAKSVSDLLAGVDLAMYRAKELGKDATCALESMEGRLSSTRASRDYAETLRLALRENRMQPYFQPILDCRTGELYACETVARMKTPEGETVSAGMFIETIEKYGLGRELDRTIIGQALHKAREHRLAGHVPHRVFINLSAQEIQGRGILGYAEELCNQLEIPPEQIVFEVLERDAIGDMTNMRKFLANLRKKGFSFALDDFGSGYNSFHYLRELHFEYVKIDGAFVRNIVQSAIDRALVRNLARLCQELGILTVAEFVENEEILVMLRDMGIDYVQGYHLGIPQPEMPVRR